MSAVVDLARPDVPLIPRWPGHGDLMIVVRDGVVYVRADQVEQLAGIPPWSTGETLLEAVWPLTLDGRDYYVLDVAIARCEAAGTSVADEFLTWLQETLEVLLVDEHLERAQRLPGFLDAFPVGGAARRLDVDPSIRVPVGEHWLFAHLAGAGWIARTDPAADWSVTDLARRRGWLTFRPLPRHWTHDATPYPQVHVTPAGLAELASRLRALDPPPRPVDPRFPTLFD